MRDVAIVGAGPAGLESARVLASLGHDVLVLEEHPAVGVPVHCTGLFGLDAFSEFDIPCECVLGTADGAAFVAADGSSVVVAAEAVRAVVVDRARFDRSLADASVRAGAELRAGARVRSITVESTRVVLTFDDQPPVHARACIVACGASYRLNRQLGLGVPRTFVQSAQLERPFEGPERVEVHLGREVAPSGFAWLVPFTRAGTPFNRIGLMCDTRAAPRFRAFAGRVRDRFGVPEDGWPEPRLKILPLGPVSRTVRHPRARRRRRRGTREADDWRRDLLRSDQRPACRQHARRSAARERSERHEASRCYESEWRGRLGAEIRTGLAFRTLVARINDRAIDAFIELARIDGLIPLLRQTADFNWHRRSALALLRHAQFRRILLSSIWS